MDVRRNPVPATDPEPQAKRRKIRRGTHSCWECKRRKVRCKFSSSEDEVCVACRRRGAKCINQELPEEHSLVENCTEPPIKQFSRAENNLQGFPKNVHHTATGGHGVATPNRSESHHIEFLTPASTSNEGISQITTVASISRRNSPVSQRLPQAASPWVDDGNHRTLSGALHSVFPSQQDLDILCNAEYKPAIYFYQVSLNSYKHLEQEGFDRAATMKEKPSPHAHPVLLAKRMLILAIFLYNLIPKARHGLSEHPRVMMKRLANAATRLVTTNDELSGTMEFLECQMLEGSYYWYCGSLRRAYLSWRRALVLAQVMGIHRQPPPLVKRIEPSTANSPQFVWFRIVYMDRFFSLMLRLPQGTAGANVGHEAALVGATPNERLERAHAVVAGHILERNERDPTLKEYSTTQDIDKELLRAASSLPPRFWSHPNLAGVEMKSKDAFREVIRQVDQIFHYTLVNLLHLPYLLCFNTESKYEYSRMACVNASREVLMRLGAFDNYDAVTTYCRPAHFFALMGAVTLLLAHINNRQIQESANSLAHQRLGDHAMVEQVAEKMELVGRLSEDALLEKSAVLLRRLLDAEEDSAQGHSYTLQATEANDDDLYGGQPGRDELQITLPYFGSIRLAREASDTAEGTETPNARDCNMQNTTSPNPCRAELEAQTEASSSLQHLNSPSESVPTAEQQMEQIQSLDVGTTANVDSGIFGDIDTAFFEHLMSSINVPGTDTAHSGEMWDWGYGELFGNE